jgi:hypothetical protein
VKKAEWDTGYRNSLPNSAFAHVTPEGKRMFPHHNTGGGIDLPHLRNALSRLPQANLPDPIKAKIKRHLQAHGKSEDVGKSLDFDIAKADSAQHLVWTVAMKPNDVDPEGQWASPDTIMETAHRFMLKGAGIYLEHRKDISDRVKVVQSWVVPEDWNLDNRVVKAGSWVVVLKVLDDALWGLVEKGTFKGVSIRGVSKVRRASPEKAPVPA